MIWNRRRLLKAGGAFAGISAAALWGRPAPGLDLTARRDPAKRRIALLNLHTDERVEVDYFRDGAYVPEALSAIEVCLRDFRTAAGMPSIRISWTIWSRLHTPWGRNPSSA